MMRTSRRQLAARVVTLLKDHSAASVMKLVAAELKRRRATAEADLLLNDISLAVLAAEHHLTATVTSAHPLTPTTKATITAWLKQQYHAASVSCQYILDPTLIGGVVIETPQHRCDFSHATRLHRLTSHS